jgi:hypothetical protein
MNPTGNGWRTDPKLAYETPSCPRCQTSMASALREPPRSELNLRVGSPSPPQHLFEVWLCAKCGVEQRRHDRSR